MLRTERITHEAAVLHALLVEGHRRRGRHDLARENQDRTTAVHYLESELTPDAERALRDLLEKKRKASELKVEVSAEHPRCTPGAPCSLRRPSRAFPRISPE